MMQIMIAFLSKESCCCSRNYCFKRVEPGTKGQFTSLVLFIEQSNQINTMHYLP